MNNSNKRIMPVGRVERSHSKFSTTALTEGGRYLNKVAYLLLKSWQFESSDDYMVRYIVENERILAYPDKENSHDNPGLDTWRGFIVSQYMKEEDGKASYMMRKRVTRQTWSEVLARIENDFPEVNQPWKFSEMSETMAEMLDLKEPEKLVLEFTRHLHTGYHNDLTRCLDNIRHIDRFEKPFMFYQYLFDLTSDQVDELQKSYLFKSGLLTSNKLTHNFHDELFGILVDSTFSLETLKNKLFPSSFTSTLTVEDYPHLSKEIEQLANLINNSLNDKEFKERKGLNVLFYGLPGTGKTELALALAKNHGWNLHVVGDISNTDDEEKGRSSRLLGLRLAGRLFRNDPKSVILFDEMEDIRNGTQNNAEFSKAFINRILENTEIPIIWTSNSVRSFDAATLRRMVYSVKFEVPPATVRRTMWESATKRRGIELGSEKLDNLAETFKIVPAMINNAVRVASMVDTKDEEVIIDIIKRLDTLVNHGEERKYNDVSLKETPYNLDVVNTGHDMVKFTDRLIAANPAFSLCLYGAPGTGKSEYGRYLAKKMGKKVLYKRASDLQSMWVGECEKNIAKAFKEARDNEMVLIIDEGDSFLQNRANAKNSWEISQVNEMLSQMENHNQPFIITTNLMDNLDPASLRRFTFKLKFDYLSPEGREELFKAYFGVDAPQAIQNLDYLAPGDFSVVKNRVTILDIQDADEILNMILEEMELKPDAKTKRQMGFQT